MKYMTYVIEYNDDEKPPQLLGKPALDGSVIGMSVGDEMLKNEQLEDELLDWKDNDGNERC